MNSAAHFIAIHLEFDKLIAQFWARHGDDALEECLYEAAAAHIIAFDHHERFCTLVKRFEQYEKDLKNGTGDNRKN